MYTFSYVTQCIGFTYKVLFDMTINERVTEIDYVMSSSLIILRLHTILENISNN